MKVIFAHSEVTICRMFESERFSNWNRMVRVVAYALRFIQILKAKVRKQSFNGSYLNREELVAARNVIFRQAQFESFPDEMVTLTLNKNRDTKDQITIQKSSSLISYSPYLDELGVLRLRGRIDLASIPQESKRKIILPRKNWITKLFVDCYHRTFRHRNHETVVNHIRQDYYIPKLRIVLKSIVHNCQTCKNRRAAPEMPEEGNLPFGRLAIGFRSFTHTGIDFLARTRSYNDEVQSKDGACLFTCLTIRAIHIEIVHSMDTNSCIMALRNFILIRSRPTEIYSDN